MSRQSKNAKKRALAKHFTELHLQGQKGPAKTKPLHGKKHTLIEVTRAARLAAVKAAAEAHTKKQEQAANDSDKRKKPRNKKAA